MNRRPSWLAKTEDVCVRVGELLENIVAGLVDGKLNSTYLTVESKHSFSLNITRKIN